MHGKLRCCAQTSERCSFTFNMSIPIRIHHFRCGSWVRDVCCFLFIFGTTHSYECLIKYVFFPRIYLPQPFVCLVFAILYHLCRYLLTGNSSSDVIFRQHHRKSNSNLFTVFRFTHWINIYIGLNFCMSAYRLTCGRPKIIIIFTLDFSSRRAGSVHSTLCQLPIIRITYAECKRRMGRQRIQKKSTQQITGAEQLHTGSRGNE